MLRKVFLLLPVLMLAWVPLASGTDVAVSNVSLGVYDNGIVPVNFDISWNNSWRSTGSGAPAPNNWDAAWVFIKFRKNGGEWAHAHLYDAGHTVPSGASLDVGLVDTGATFNNSSNPGVGVFIYRSADGTGTFSKTGFSLLWDYPSNGVSENDVVDIRVYAIEMVYILDGAFFAGDNGTVSSALKQGSSDTDPWYIGSEGAITTANSAGTGTGQAETASEYYYVTDPNTNYDDATGAVFTIPSAFPKGYRRMYMMKGEVSQRQWVSFFNTLTTDQKSTRDITASSGKNSDSLTYRNNVSWSSGDAVLPDQGGGATYGSVAMNYLSWPDLAAYLDWAGLRPMSELEFEKAGRGPYRVVAGEYAWGSSSITQATSIVNDGTSTEGPGSAANAVYGNTANVQGPMRVGAMGYGDTTRIDSGAGYYGAMDLSGNMWERTVTVGNSAGRSFEGRYHGNGVLDATGNANVSTWPGTDGDGQGYRGGVWDASNASSLRLADRAWAATKSAVRNKNGGGRGVRSAP